MPAVAGAVAGGPPWGSGGPPASPHHPEKRKAPRVSRGASLGRPVTSRATKGVARGGDTAPGPDDARSWRDRASLVSLPDKWVTGPRTEADDARADALQTKREAWLAEAADLEARARRWRAAAGAGASGASLDRRALAARVTRRARRLRARARRTLLPGSVLRAGCGEPLAVHTACGCGRRWLQRRCNQRWTCGECRARWSRRQRARILRAVGDRRDRAYLVTPTIRHSGDPGKDWDGLQAAWRTWRRWLARQLDGAPEYVRVWEATAGRDGKGHVHCHLVVWASRIDYAAAVAAWRRATGDKDARIDFRVVRQAKDVVRYVSKYVSKGVDVLSMSPILQGKLEAAANGRRMLSTSRGFWAPYTPKCGACGCRFKGPTKALWEATKRSVKAGEVLAAFGLHETGIGGSLERCRPPPTPGSARPEPS